MQLNDIAQLFIDEIIKRHNAAGQRTTGASTSSENLFYKLTENGFEIWAPLHFKQLEQGRAPLEKPVESSNLWQILQKWHENKGLGELTDNEAKSLAWYINKKGTYLFREGKTYNGTVNPVTGFLTPEFINEVSKMIMESEIININSKILEGFKI